MKIHRIVLTVLSAALLLLALGSCILGTSMDERIDMFVADLNFNRSSCYTNFHPDLCSDYDSLKNPTLTLDPAFPTAYISYDVYNRSESGETVTATIEGYGGAGFWPQSIRFYMAKDGTDYKIVRLDSPTGNTLWE